MKIHEYQAAELFRSYGLLVPTGHLAESVDEAVFIAENLLPCVIKAQVHSGGRGKAGGVKLARTPEEVEKITGEMLGMKLVTRQTGPEGKIVRKVYLTETVNVSREYYTSVTTDNESGNYVMILSAEGGTEIEEISAQHPERILKVPVSVTEGFKRYQGILAADFLGLSGENQKELIRILQGMIRLYTEKDCSLVEINPLVLTEEGRLVCLDAKVNFDDNALFRHPEIVALRDVTEEDEREYKASEFGLNYISLKGNIGCLVNGAGLAMATMDEIKAMGGEPANFLDVGGSATAEKVAAAFRLLLSDDNVEAIFVNIFGGIMHCDIIAEGVITAVAETGLNLPLVVRLEGTNAKEGQRLLRESHLAIIPASDMADGAKKAVEAAKTYREAKEARRETTDADKGGAL